MLKNIPSCISPDFMVTMMHMGHGDELVLADADFPVDTFSKRVVRADGLKITTLLEAILPFSPLDPFVEKPVMTMDYRAWSKEEPASYAMFRETIRKFQTTNLLYTIPFVLYGIFRYLYLVHQKKIGSNPTLVLLRDKPMLLNIILWIIICIIILY